MSASADYHRERRRDPVLAERDRESSRRWKAANRERNRARDRARLRDLRDPCPRCGTLKQYDAAKCQECVSADAEERRSRIAEMYEAGVPLRGIAEAFGVSVGSISRELDPLRKAGRVGRRYRVREEARA